MPRESGAATNCWNPESVSERLELVEIEDLLQRDCVRAERLQNGGDEVELSAKTGSVCAKFWTLNVVTVMGIKPPFNPHERS